MSSIFSTLFDWVLTHLVAIALCGFLLVAIIGRESLFGWSPEQQALPSGPETASAVNPTSADEATQVENATDQLTPSQSVELQEAAAEQVSAKTSSEQGETVFRPTPGEPVSSDHQQFVPVDVVKEAKRAERGHEAQPSSEDLIDPGALLQAARMAFWEGSLEKAESSYLSYLAERPGDAEGFGELGNLYQSMGRRQDALDAYFEAGVRFKAQGQREPLLQIVELLSEAKDPRSGKLLSD